MIRPNLKAAGGRLLERLPGPVRRVARRAYYGRLVRAAGEDAQTDLRLLKRVVAKGDLVVDAGASIGLFTKFLSALAGPEGLVYSIEPVPETYDVLESNVRGLGLANVRPQRCALSDADGELEMEVPRWSHGGENLYEARVTGGPPSGLRRVRVAARRLDALVPDRQVAFVKCDVEGHELACLQGAAEILRRWRPAWLLEVWGDPDAEGSHARRVFRFMEDLGYVAYWCDGHSLILRGPGRRSDNYWFLTSEQARRARHDPGRGCDRVAPTMPICIAGMHRAGTSMVARMLEGCGVDLGGPTYFAPPAPDNRDGYWEDLRFVGLNDRILDRFQGAWDHPPVLPDGWETSSGLDGERRDAEAILRWKGEPWGWKDPRNSLTIPFWRSLLPGIRVIVCVRNPLEVSDSLRARGYTSERFGLALWEAYYRAIEATVDGSFGLVTHYDSFLADPGAELDRVLAFLDLRPPGAVRDAVLSSAHPGARHQRRTAAEVEASGLTAEGRRLYAALRERGGPVYREVERRSSAEPLPPSAPAPAAPEPPRPRSHAEEIAEITAVLEAREAELASIKPVLAARDQEAASLKAVLAARDERIASILEPLTAHRDEIAAMRLEVASLRARLADRDRLVGSLKGLLAAIRNLVVPGR